MLEDLVKSRLAKAKEINPLELAQGYTPEVNPPQSMNSEMILDKENDHDQNVDQGTENAEVDTF